jgi:chloramphenicol-sensitive protein RarD
VNVSRGYIYGVIAYGLWGLAPLYWPLVEPSTALETLAHRMVWSLFFLIIINLVLRNWKKIFESMKDRRVMLLLLAAAIAVTTNWGLYIWAVTNEHVIDSSLGYFINPLINVALGIFVFAEKLKKVQWLAIGIAATGVLWLTVNSGSIPWIGLILGFSFSIYGMLKKLAGLDGVESLTIESIWVFPIALGYLIYLGVTSQLVFGSAGISHTFFAIMAGLFTALPLLAFGAAAVRIPYSSMGILQYLSPTIQFIIGYFIVGETMTQERWIGYILVWIALTIFASDALRRGLKSKSRASAS